MSSVEHPPASEDSYTFTFRGELSPYASKDDVIHKLSSIFHCEPEALNPIFTGDAIFERNNIDKLTAQAYAAQFQKIGALGFVSQAPAQTAAAKSNKRDAIKANKAHSNFDTPLENSQPSPTHIDDVKHCPKCNSSKLQNGQCQDCGVFLHKVLAVTTASNRKSETNVRSSERAPLPVQNVSTPVQQIISGGGSQTHDKSQSLQSLTSSTGNITNNSETDVEALLQRQRERDAQKEKNKSQRWLTYSSIAIIAIIMGDQALQNFHTLEQAGVDIGILPLLVAHLCLLRGCFLFAKEQDLEMYYGLLGLLSIAGLALLSLIATRHQGNPIRLKQLGFVVFSFAVVYHWSGSLGVNSNIYQQQVMENQHLAEGRHEYPSNTLQNDPEIYSSEEKEILDYLTSSLEILTTKKMRPNQVEKIADIVFSEFTRYQAWRNYQYFLHASQGKTLPTIFDEDQVTQHHKKFKNLLNARINRFSSHPRLVRSYEAWAASAIPDTIPKPALGITRTIHNIYDRFRFSADGKTPKNTDIALMNNVDLSSLLPTPGEGVHVMSEGNIVTITFDDPRLKRTPLAIAFYWEKAKSKRRITRKNSDSSNFVYKANIAIITPNFPYKYISGGYLHILDEYELLH